MGQDLVVCYFKMSTSPELRDLSLINSGTVDLVYGFCREISDSFSSNNDYHSLQTGIVDVCIAFYWPWEEQKVAEENEAKRVRRRAQTVKELIATERDYVQCLELLTEIYIEPLSSTGSHSNIINADQHRLLFDNINGILKLHKQFQTELELRYRDWDPCRSKIADIFIQFAPFFNTYQNFLYYYQQAAELVCKLYSKSKKFKKFLDSAQFNPKCRGCDLKSYLIRPVARINKYILLLKCLAEYTLENHPDYEDLKVAIDKMNQTNQTNAERIEQRKTLKHRAKWFKRVF